MARPSLDYYKNFRAIVENIRNKQPKAIIFIQGSINIAPPRCQTDPVFNNTNLYQRNKAIAELRAEGKLTEISNKLILCLSQYFLISKLE